MTLPATLTILGVGPGDRRLRPAVVEEYVELADHVILRTAVHPDVEDLASIQRVVACDDLYRTGASFGDVYGLIADRVVEYANGGSVVYIVPGSPVFGESTVDLVLQRANEQGIETAVMPAISGLDAIVAALGVDLLVDEVQIIDAMSITHLANAEPFSGGTAHLDPYRPMIIGQVYSKSIAADVKHVLFRLLPETHQMTIVRSAGIPADQDLRPVSLHDLDHGSFDHLTSVWVPALDQFNAGRSPSTLHHLVSYLRSPVGCPWDREQTHATLRDKIIEEAHEVVDAIDSGADAELASELGDLLLVVLMNCQIAEERGAFNYEDVYAAISEKLIRRHPHVFGDQTADTPEAVMETWKRVKADEKSESLADATPRLRYDELPKSLPVMTRVRIAEQVAVSKNKESDPEAIGSELLTLVDRALSAGLDPERLLESAYRALKTSENTELNPTFTSRA